MPSLPNPRTILKKRLEGAKAVAVLAVGSSLRGDDAAGLLAAEELRKLLPNEAAPGKARVEIFVGETAPENLTGEIKRFKPSHLVIIDAADAGREPGHVDVIDPDWLTANASASTHALPVSVLTEYLRRFLHCETILLGIQPGPCEFGAPASPPVQAAARDLAAMLADALA
jgi:hydrogenase 3 maturation protease